MMWMQVRYNCCAIGLAHSLSLFTFPAEPLACQLRLLTNLTASMLDQTHERAIYHGLVLTSDKDSMGESSAISWPHILKYKNRKVFGMLTRLMNWFVADGMFYMPQKVSTCACRSGWVLGVKRSEDSTSLDGPRSLPTTWRVDYHSNNYNDDA